ncbi:hypothetical protein CSPAE12_01129, partial [Colletotrichum incanum]
KTRERRSLAEAVKRFGVDVMPCTYCFKSNKVCKMAEESSRYGECIRTGRSQCDSNNVASASTEDRGGGAESRGGDRNSLNSTCYCLRSLVSPLEAKAFLKGSWIRVNSPRDLEAKDKEVADIEARVKRDLVAWGASDVLDWSSLGVGPEFADLGPLSPPRDTAGASSGNAGGS